MMGMGALLIVAGLAAVDEPGPADWVRRLGSDRFADRVEAARALEKLGPAAMPALQAARDSDKPRVRSRVAALIESIGRGADLARFTRPTLIRLDFRDRPLSEVIDTLNARHHLGLTFQFGPLPFRGMIVGRPPGPNPKEVAARSRRVTLEADGPLPFWKAIDRLCEAGQLRHDLHPESGFGLSIGQFRLFASVPGGRSVASDSGPMRVKVIGLHSTFERNLVGEARPGYGHLAVRMAIVPEPGLVVRQIGPPTVAEAVDDRGRSLLPADPDPPTAHYQPPSLNGPAGFEISSSLSLPDMAVRSIRRLRGSVPVVMVARASDPIAIPLEGSAGKSAGTDEVTIRILAVPRAQGGGIASVEIEVINNRPERPGYRAWDPKAPPDFVRFDWGRLLDRLELLDADGREIALGWTQGHGTNMMIARRFRLMPRGPRQDGPHGPPVELRFHDFVQKMSAVEFDFHDIPMP